MFSILHLLQSHSYHQGLFYILGISILCIGSCINSSKTTNEEKSSDPANDTSFHNTHETASTVSHTLIENSGSIANDNPLSHKADSPSPFTPLSDSLFHFIDEQSEPGCLLAIYRSGKMVTNATHGLANLDYQIPLSDSSSFFMGTLSQEATAATVLDLFSKGLLDSEKKVSHYLEDWPDWAESVRIRDLINQTCGLPDIFELMDILGKSINDVMTTKDYYSVLLNAEGLMQPAGHSFRETSSGYFVLAWLIETLTKKPLSAFSNDLLFKPLGMDRTLFHDDRYTILPQRAISYTRNVSEDDNASFIQTYPGNFQGTGPIGLYSTILDWITWESALSGYFDPSNSFLPLKQLAEKRKAAYHAGSSFSYGNHIQSWKGLYLESQNSSFYGFNTALHRFPEQDLSIITLCNRSDTNPAQINQTVSRTLLKDEIESYLRPYAGSYYNHDIDVSIQLTVEDGALVSNRSHSPRGSITEIATDYWAIGSWEVFFQRDDSGDITGFLVNTGRIRNMLFLKQ